MKPAAACPSRRELEQLRLGLVAFARVEELAQHLERCPACVHTFQALQGEDTLAEVLCRQAAEPPMGHATIVGHLMDRLRRLRAHGGSATDSEAATIPPGDESEVPSYSFLAPALEPDERGRLGSYRILDVLGAGGMGVVFLAADARLKRRVALKVIKPDLVRRPEARARFLREAQAVAKVEHDNIVSILHVDEAGGVPFLAMPLLRGESLEERVRRAGGPLPVDETLRVAREVASGLAAAHDHGLVHRDIKPANIFLAAAPAPSSTDDTLRMTGVHPAADRPGKVKILDFGLARAVRSNEPGLSQHGQILGTPAYMAPEQACGQSVDHRADLFSLGCVLYRMATGEQPFPGSDAVAVLVAVATMAPRPPSEINPDLPPALARLIDQLLAKDPRDRPVSSHAVVEAIEAIERTRSTVRRFETSRRGLLMMAGICLATCLVLGAWLAAMLLWPKAEVSPELPWSGPETAEAVTFDFVEPGVQLAVQRGEEKEIEINPAVSPKYALLPGTYRMRPMGARDGRRLVPDVFVVKAGQPLTVAPRLVGEVAQVGGFGGTVTGVAASPVKDNPIILASSLDANSVLGVWDGSASQFRFPVGLATRMQCVALAPDGVHAATGPARSLNERMPDLDIRVWDVHLAKPIVLKNLHGHRALVAALAYSPNGTRLVSGDANGFVFIWDLENVDKPVSLQAHEGAVNGVAFWPDGKQFLSAGSDKVAILWDIKSRKEVSRLPEHPGRILAVNHGPGPEDVTTACEDGLIRIWDLKKDKGRELKGHRGAVNCVTASSDGQRLLSGGADGTVRLWDAVRASEVYQFAPGEAAVNGVAFTAAGRRAVSGGKDGKLRLWELPR
jgi:serine/threonine protein kinase